MLVFSNLRLWHGRCISGGMNDRMSQVQSSTVKVMDTIVLEVAKMDAFQKYHFVNKVKNFIDLIEE